MSAGLEPSGQEPTAAYPVDEVPETALVRPYALTGGQTTSNYVLELETLISATDTSAPVGGSPVLALRQTTHRSIVAECQTPRSVAELVAALRVPLGVVRVLVSDAADAGMVTVHKTVSTKAGGKEHLLLMERVLSGLRRL